MASIIDAWRDVFTDKHALIKLIAITIAVEYDYTLFLGIKTNPFGFYLLTTVLVFFGFGILIKVTNNIINERIEVLPPLNPFKLALSSAKGILAILPACLIGGFVANLICTLLNTIPWFDYTVKTLAWLIVTTIIVTCFLMFSAEEKVKDAFNMGILAAKAGDLLLNIVFLIIQVVAINALVIGFIGYALMILFGPGPALYYFLSFMLVLNISALGHYFGQMYYENVQYSN